MDDATCSAKHLMHLFGLSRSGNHAILTWLFGHYHDADHKAFQAMSTRDINKPFRLPLVVTDRVAFLNDRRYGAQLPAEEVDQITGKDLVVVGFENVRIDTPVPPILNLPASLSSNKRVSLLLLRDPFNFMASRVKNTCLDSNVDPIRIEQARHTLSLWKLYAREFLGETSYLADKVTINFNRWHSDQQYREELATTMGLRFTDRTRSIVSAYGGGSTFDGLNYQGRGDQMDVNRRWKRYADGPFFRSFFQDCELLELSRRVFGWIPETERLIDDAVLEKIGGPFPTV